MLRIIVFLLILQKVKGSAARHLGLETYNGNMKRLLLIAFLALAANLGHVSAQNITISTNLLDWANLGTINGDATISVARRWAIGVNAEYNPWTFKLNGGENWVYNRHRTFGVYGEWWPWYVNAEWALQFGAQYKEYAEGGFPFFKRNYGERFGSLPLVEEGDAVGGGLAVKYSLLLSKNWSLEFSAGAWAGWKWYTRYRCPNCGRRLEEGEGFFVAPYNVAVRMVFVIPLGEAARHERETPAVPYRWNR